MKGKDKLNNWGYNKKLKLEKRLDNKNLWDNKWKQKRLDWKKLKDKDKQLNNWDKNKRQKPRHEQKRKKDNVKLKPQLMPNYCLISKNRSKENYKLGNNNLLMISNNKGHGRLKKSKRRKKSKGNITTIFSKCNKLKLHLNKQNKITISLNQLKNKPNYSIFKTKRNCLSHNNKNRINSLHNKFKTSQINKLCKNQHLKTLCMLIWWMMKKRLQIP